MLYFIYFRGLCTAILSKFVTHFRFRIVSDAYVDKLGGISSQKLQFDSIRVRVQRERANERV